MKNEECLSRPTASEMYFKSIPKCHRDWFIVHFIFLQREIHFVQFASENGRRAKPNRIEFNGNALLL